MMNERSAGGDGDEAACGFAAVTRYTCVCGCPVERICVAVRPTTGGQFLVSIAADQSVEHLRQMVAQKLRVPRERICLLYRNKPLRSGTLLANSVQHGTHVTLLPSVEAGLVSHRPELSVLQALENLTPTQVTEFLSGKAPLNLTVRLGDHMMLIQLQLSPAPQTGASAAAARRSSRHAATSSSSSATAAAAGLGTAAAAATSSGGSGGERRGGGGLRTGAPPPPPCHHQHSPGEPGNPLSGHAGAARTQLDVRALAEASRNLTRTLKQLSSEVLSDDWSAPPQSAAVTTPSSASAAAATSSAAAATPGTCSSSGVRCRKPSQDTGSSASSSSSSQLSDLRGSSSALSSSTPPAATSFSSALSSSTSAGGTASSGLTSPRLARPGAIIETMHHHGKGVYSGTFSGTLNPTLQDRMGRPKRDIGTIIHILNDLLCAAPQYRGQEPQQQQHQQGEPEGRLAPPQPPFDSLSSTASKGEELATRGKIEHLKMVMEERRRRRRQRQRRTAPYTTSWSATHETATAASSATASATTAPAATAADKREQVEADIADAVTTPALVACGGQHL